MRYLVYATIVGILLLGGPAFAQSQEATLRVLADQTFQKLLDEYVTLPDGTTERIGRSTDQLPAGVPEGTPYGLVEKRYVESGFIAAGQVILNEETFITVRNEAEGFDVIVWFKRDSNNEITITGKLAVPIGLGTTSLSPMTGGDPCDSDDDNDTCNCQGDDGDGGCTSANCGSDGIYQDTGDEDEHGNDIMANVETGVERVECGSAGPGFVILSPR